MATLKAGALSPDSYCVYTGSIDHLLAQAFYSTHVFIYSLQLQRSLFGSMKRAAKLHCQATAIVYFGDPPLPQTTNLPYKIFAIKLMLHISPYNFFVTDYAFVHPCSYSV